VEGGREREDMEIQIWESVEARMVASNGGAALFFTLVFVLEPGSGRVAAGVGFGIVTAFEFGLVPE
jgi:hypothetical protein